MNITKDTLLEARAEASKQTALITLMSQYNLRKKNIWIVVEGKNDTCYYVNTIEKIIPNDWNVVPIEAGSKTKVISVLKSLDWNQYDKKRILFFIDRDLSDFINDINVSSSNLYVTDGYSIENSFVNDDVMFHVFDELLGLHCLTEDEKSSITALFQSAKDEFVKGMTIPMAILLCLQKRNIKTDGFNNIKVKQLFAFSRGVCSSQKSSQEFYDYVTQKLDCIGLFSDAEFDDSKTQFTTHNNHENLIRGKYMLEFFVLFILSIRNEWNSIEFAKTTACNRSVTLGVENAFTHIAVWVRLIPSLREFYKLSIIKRWLK